MIAQWYRDEISSPHLVSRFSNHQNLQTSCNGRSTTAKISTDLYCTKFACMQAFKTSGIWCVAGLRPVSKPWLWFLVHHAINIIGLVCLIFVKFVLYDLQFIMVNIYFIKTFYLRYFFVCTYILYLNRVFLRFLIRIVIVQQKCTC